MISYCSWFRCFLSPLSFALLFVAGGCAHSQPFHRVPNGSSQFNCESDSSLPEGYASVEDVLSRAKNADLKSGTKRWRVLGADVYFDGTISKGDCSQFKELDLKQVTRLIVNSSGGDAFEGLCIAKKIKELNLDVTVRGLCVSSCANYLFTAAHAKKLEVGVVGYHGNITAVSRGFDNEEKNLREQLKKQGLSEDLISKTIKEFRIETFRNAQLEKEYFRALKIPQELFDRTQIPDKGTGTGAAYTFLLPSPTTFQRYNLAWRIEFFLESWNLNLKLV